MMIPHKYHMTTQKKGEIAKVRDEFLFVFLSYIIEFYFTFKPEEEQYSCPKACFSHFPMKTSPNVECTR